MKKEIKCPWCDEITKGEVKKFDNDYGTVMERRCTACGKIIASYMDGEGDFMPKIRVFENVDVTSQ